MLSFELLAPGFANPPHLTITWRSGSEGGSLSLPLPLLPMRFASPWPLGKDDYFRMWRSPELKEAQSKFTFGAAHEVSAVKGLLAGCRLAVLEGVDPSPTNLCCAGAINVKGTALPPAAGGQYCLLRLEIIPNYTKAADGSPRAASRLTVRATHPLIGEGLVNALTAFLGPQK